MRIPITKVGLQQVYDYLKQKYGTTHKQVCLEKSMGQLKSGKGSQTGIRRPKTGVGLPKKLCDYLK